MTAPSIPAGVADLADRLAVWRTLINGKLPGSVAVKQIDQSRNTTTTYANDADLIIPVVANGLYRYTFHAGMTAGATPQIKVQLSVPSGSTLRAGVFMFNATTGAAAGATHSVAGMAGTDFYYVQKGLLIVGATAGDCAIQWAQTVSNAANVTVHKGSCLILARLV